MTRTTASAAGTANDGHDVVPRRSSSAAGQRQHGFGIVPSAADVGSVQHAHDDTVSSPKVGVCALGIE
ncbi:MAG: hypothetical protein MK074_00820 [Phycisphaerales bacterium]|nr:hypothetical protein [Phycisphaerales bacterium]